MNESQHQEEGVASNRAEVLSIAVRANMHRGRDLPIAEALQPVAAVAWAVVDGLADHEQLLATAQCALSRLALHIGAFEERKMLNRVIWDCQETGATLSVRNASTKRVADARLQ